MCFGGSVVGAFHLSAAALSPVAGLSGEGADPAHHAVGSISDLSRTVLAAFVSQSVATKTSRVYEGHWTAWTKFVCEETRTSDPSCTE